MRASLAVKPLHRVNTHTSLDCHCDGYLSFWSLFSRYARRFALSIAHAVTRYPVLTEQARHLLGSKGNSPRSNLESAMQIPRSMIEANDGREGVGWG